MYQNKIRLESIISVSILDDHWWIVNHLEVNAYNNSSALKTDIIIVNNIDIDIKYQKAVKLKIKMMTNDKLYSTQRSLNKPNA